MNNAPGAKLDGKPALRGEIRFTKIPTDPPEKGRTPVVIVSRDERNKHPKANTVLVVPLTTTLTQGVPTHVLLLPGETGLAEKSVLRAEDVTVIRKVNLQPPGERLRTLSNSRICEIADKIRIACGCDPK
jgi:mRNA-degrading endonuclease toxin of MazEF toxin-antitoxin module